MGVRIIIDTSGFVPPAPPINWRLLRARVRAWVRRKMRKGVITQAP